MNAPRADLEHLNGWRRFWYGRLAYLFRELREADRVCNETGDHSAAIDALHNQLLADLDREHARRQHRLKIGDASARPTSWLGDAQGA